MDIITNTPVFFSQFKQFREALRKFFIGSRICDNIIQRNKMIIDGLNIEKLKEPFSAKFYCYLFNLPPLYKYDYSYNKEDEKKMNMYINKCLLEIIMKYYIITRNNRSKCSYVRNSSRAKMPALKQTSSRSITKDMKNSIIKSDQ